MELCEGKIFRREKVLEAPLQPTFEYLCVLRLNKLNADIERLNNLERTP
jgi:hypothetical protein